MLNIATNAMMNAAIQHYIDKQAKELPGLPEPNVPEGDWFVLDCYIKEYAQAYGAACAAHAREMAISETLSIAYGYADSLTWNDDFKAEIKALKGK